MNQGFFPGQLAKRIDQLCVAFLSLLFAYAGLDKLVHLAGFANAIDDYGFLPIPIGSTIAPAIIAAELTTALGLAAVRWRRHASLLAAFMLAAFSAALLAGEARGRSGACGCWFSIDLAPGRLHLVLNGLLIVLSLLIWRSSLSLSPEHLQSRGPS